MTILIIIFVIIGLSLLILAHEAGHFICSKFFGVRVDEFGIGFPPRIFAWRPTKNKVTVVYQESETDKLLCGTILVEGKDIGNHLAGVCADTRKGEILSIEVEVAN